MDSYMRMFIDNEIYSAKVTIKSYLNSAVNTIKEKLSTTQLGKFDKTYFGHFLNMYKLQFSGQVVNHMLWRQCIYNDPNIMVFNFGGSSARFTIQEFCLISGLFYNLIPSTRPTTSGHFHDTYFGGRKFPLHNHDIVEVFSTATCENNDDMVKLALLYFLETVILSKEKPTLIPVECVDMLDDIEYFLAYPWGTLSYHATINSMRGCPGKRSNASHTYSITGFPIAFMVWGYETIPSLAEAFGIKSSLPLCPRMRNSTVSGMPKKKILEDIFAGQDPSNAASVVEDKPDIDPDADRVYSVPDKDKTSTKKNDAVKQGRRHLRRHSSPSAYTPAASACQLFAMEERLSSMDSRLSSIDCRQSSIDSRLSSTYNTIRVQLDEEDDQYFDEVGGEDVGVGDAYRTCDLRTDHAANHLVPPVSISSSSIAESEHSVKVFTQMSDRKLAGD
ncbi:hypothetical protein FNV43_RR00616 [Rhamnella rubrinervis]|uniref:DUF1985 domain-containing protein n=1 Tax=Rhamnella rubrinervis TaxID=2594499 RepID=A0A8K0HPX2_9ROSA|nr:hypothetical protein FNV43_RR00616 [Rhamnella rubrinervis]